MTPTATATGWYVYGVVDGGAAEPAPGPARLVRSEGLAAIVAEVRLEEFDEATLVDRLNDRVWLEARVREHEAVLERVAAKTTVVPFRFGAIYRRLPDVVELLDDRREELRSALARVRGRVELGVKGWVDFDRVRAVLERGHARAGSAGGGSGRAYLERRRTERQVADEAAATVTAIARDAHEGLLRRAIDGVVNRPQPRELTGRDEDMFLNGAYLVSSDDESSPQR